MRSQLHRAATDGSASSSIIGASSSFDLSIVVNVSAGYMNGVLYDDLAKLPEPLAAVSGTCYPVGLAGLALGGGIGILSRQHGLACDRIVAMQVVLYDGTVVVADETEHPDLYWALKGAGGGSFGIVTSFKVAAVNITRTSFAFAKFTLPNYGRTTGNSPAAHVQAVRAFDAWQRWAPVEIDGLYSQFALGGNGRVASRDLNIVVVVATDDGPAATAAAMAGALDRSGLLNKTSLPDMQLVTTPPVRANCSDFGVPGSR